MSQKSGAAAAVSEPLLSDESDREVNEKLKEEECKSKAVKLAKERAAVKEEERAARDEIKFQDGVCHVIFQLIMVALAFTCAYLGCSGSQIIGIVLAILGCGYVLHVWILFLSAESLYQIESMCYAPRDENKKRTWANMGVAHEITETKYRPIASISEFSAICGGSAKTLLARLGTYYFGIVLTFVLLQIANDPKFKVSPHLVLEIAGTFGITMIGTFYRDPFVQSMQCGHKCGVALLFLTQAGLAWQRIEDDWRYIEASVAMVGMSAIGMAYFCTFDPTKYSNTESREWENISKSGDLEKKLPQLVKWRAIRALAAESVMLAMSAISISLYFILYN